MSSTMIYNLLNGIEEFFISPFESNCLMETIRLHDKTENDVHQEILTYAHRYDLITSHVDASKLIQHVNHEKNIMQKFDAFIQMVQNTDADVIILNNWHLIFTNIIMDICKNSKNERIDQELFKDRIYKLKKEAHGKKIIVNTTVEGHQKYVKPLLTKPSSSRIRKYLIGDIKEAQRLVYAKAL